MARPLLEIKDLTTGFFTKNGVVVAVDGISFSLNEGETVVVVGESGSGKSVTSLAVMRLVDYDNGAILAGEVLFQGRDLANLSQEEMRKVRGGQIGMIFQEPMTALNPVYSRLATRSLRPSCSTRARPGKRR
jgi:peptide/nickel transport system ATP-binding protein